MNEINDSVNKLVSKVFDDFSKQVKNEKDLSIVLLKGHLLIEYYLNYVIVVLHDTKERIDNMSFHDKVKLLEQDNCFGKNVIVGLFRFNDVRNNLSHEIDYKVSESAVDSIGFNLGKDYIIEKFEKNCDNPDELKELFLWVIDKMIWRIFLPVFKEIITAKEAKKEKEAKEAKEVKTNSQ